MLCYSNNSPLGGIGKRNPFFVQRFSTRGRFIMDTRKRWLAVIALGLFTLAVPASLLAAEPADEDERETVSKVIVLHDGDEEIVIEMGDIHEIVADAMEGLDEVMAELQDMQLEAWEVI